MLSQLLLSYQVDPFVCFTSFTRGYRLASIRRLGHSRAETAPLFNESMTPNPGLEWAHFNIFHKLAFNLLFKIFKVQCISIKILIVDYKDYHWFSPTHVEQFSSRHVLHVQSSIKRVIHL